jgi:hypothetical protein
VVAVEAGHSISAANRHLRAHAYPERMREMRVSTALTFSDFADRLVALAGETETVREYAKPPATQTSCSTPSQPSETPFSPS